MLRLGLRTLNMRLIVSAHPLLIHVPPYLLHEPLPKIGFYDVLCEYVEGLSTPTSSVTTNLNSTLSLVSMWRTRSFIPFVLISQLNLRSFVP